MIRVLICDDAVAFATLVRHWLAGCDDVEVVGTAGSGAEALEVVETLAPDVIVLDHLLYDVPEGSVWLGPELRRRCPGLRIVLVSGMPGHQLAAVAERSQADAYVSKAAKSDDLCRAIREAASLPGASAEDALQPA